MSMRGASAAVLMMMMILGCSPPPSSPSMMPMQPEPSATESSAPAPAGQEPQAELSDAELEANLQRLEVLRGILAEIDEALAEQLAPIDAFEQTLAELEAVGEQHGLSGEQMVAMAAATLTRGAGAVDPAVPAQAREDVQTRLAALQEHADGAFLEPAQVEAMKARITAALERGRATWAELEQETAAEKHDSRQVARQHDVGRALFTRVEARAEAATDALDDALDRAQALTRRLEPNGAARDDATGSSSADSPQADATGR